MLVELLDTALLWFANVPIPNRAQTPKNTIVEPLRDAREPRLETMVETDSPWSEPCCVEDPNWASPLRGNGTGSSDMTCKAVGGRDMTGRPTLAARPAWRSTLHETRLEECSPGPRSEGNSPSFQPEFLPRIRPLLVPACATRYAACRISTNNEWKIAGRHARPAEQPMQQRPQHVRLRLIEHDISTRLARLTCAEWLKAMWQSECD